MRRPLRSDEGRAIANLAIDLGDPGRMAKARRMHRSNAVGTIDFAPVGAQTTVTEADEQYEVTVSIVAPPAQPIPAARDLLASCTCEDDGDACRHALAAILGIAEEVEADVRAIERWIGSDEPTTVASYESPGGDTQSFYAGNWKPDRPLAALTTLPASRLQPVLDVGGVDAGPVVIDALAAIAENLKDARRVR